MNKKKLFIKLNCVMNIRMLHLSNFQAGKRYVTTDSIIYQAKILQKQKKVCFSEFVIENDRNNAVGIRRHILNRYLEMETWIFVLC